MRTKEEIVAVANEVVGGSDLFVVDVKLLRNSVIQVYIDAPKGVSVDTCSRVCHEIENRLDRDVEDFELTVASAGIGYPFKVAGQYRKNIGNRVVLKTAALIRHEGVLKGFDGQRVVVECEEKQVVDGKRKRQTVKVEREFLLSDIREIKDVVDMRRETGEKA